MRKLVKKILPAPLHREWVKFNERRNEEVAIRRFFDGLQEQKRRIKPLAGGEHINRILIVACDPFSVFGSIGDDAMITATVQQARARNPAVEIDVLLEGADAAGLVRQRGFNPVDLFGNADFIGVLCNQFEARRYDCVVVIGADVMDGYYHPLVSAKLLASADLAAAAGIKNVILGFSFNEAPHPSLSMFYSALHSGVSINVRDPVSLGRLKSFAKTNAALVADSAFSLAASEADADTSSWIARRRAEGYRVMGFNLHPMLFKNADRSQIETIIQRGAEALRFVADARPVCWLLIPHDYRDGFGDQSCLRAIAELLPPSLDDRVRYLEGEWPAPVLKGVAGQLDGIVSGRMHLAIAGLGKGVPVICIAYQGKFEGLYQHFALSSSDLLSPSAFYTDEGIRTALMEFVDNADELRAQVQRKLPEVLGLSKSNFQIFEAFPERNQSIS
ncbi:polysaccharide pyruvyl transferase family protein [Agrobacterium sp. OT33]|uniref:polysaccharide pyruvyl transferase family protein n=1 Tax=Agrobacterium sp. OT33 TaxID=2815338 RepID=UPI001A8E16B7|nr:polysaccharide pyruvyl transferase family protein [Agrobacterium sp. OT33]